MQTIVKVREGQLEGFFSEDRKTVIFRGVPFAEPPVGALRWKRPAPKTPWDGVRSAKEFSAKCWQADLTKMDFYGKEFYSDETIARSEDCLYLNVWTPADAAPDAKLPVLFWIHGGAFTHGCGMEKEFDGEGFARQGVILVTVNYRVGALGFFAHPALDAADPLGISGNYGIYDQIAALGWVRDNIEAFGGDRENITVFGQSAGCMSVQTLISSPLTKGWIRRAILQSGGGLRSIGRDLDMAHRVEASKRLMELLGVSTVEEMHRVPAEKIAEAQYEVAGEGLPWSPAVDGHVLTVSTDEAALSGAIHDIPYMIGSCGNDIGAEAHLLERAAVRWGRNQLALGRTPAYLYFFDRKLPGDDAGAFHSSELWYVFHTLRRCWRPWEPADYEIERQMSSYWANFAKTGDPNGEGLPVWRPYTEETPVQLFIGIDTRTVDAPDAEE